MNWFLFAIGVGFIARGSWLIPSYASDARSSLAPYRALRGALYMLFGIGVVLGAAGVSFVAVVSP